MILFNAATKLPERKTEGAAAYDLYANIEGRKEIIEKQGTKIKVENNKVLLKPMGRVLIPTGIFAEPPKGHKFSVKPCSKLALQDGITILNTPGTIDSDYRGEIGVLLVNFSDSIFVISHEDRIAQLEVEAVLDIEWNIVDSLSGTVRGTNGFNSTGKR